MDARNNKAPFLNFHLISIITINRRMQYVTNKTPWIIPAIFTASGIFQMYLRGIAIPKRSKNEIPSAKLTSLKRPKALLNKLLAINFKFVKMRNYVV